MVPVFADPKTDFVFKRIFGVEAHKDLLIELLNALLELSADHRIVDVTFLPAEQRPPVAELKLSIVDVKCVDARGVRYIVEMQVLNVEAFEKRVVYNVSKGYVMQLRSAESYPELDDVIGVTICDFRLWPDKVPMLSRWRMQEQHSGELGLSQVQYVFLELPKYAAGKEPRSTVDRWAYLFREAENLDLVPAALSERPYRQVLEVARTSGFTAGEWEAYDRAKMAEQDARGAAIVAHMEGRAEGLKEGLKEGRADGLREGRADGLKEGRADGLKEGRADGLREGLRAAILDLCEVLQIAVSAEQRAALQRLAEDELSALRDQLKRERRWPAPIKSPPQS